jgi:hypothetical protein
MKLSKDLVIRPVKAAIDTNPNLKKFFIHREDISRQNLLELLLQF